MGDRKMSSDRKLSCDRKSSNELRSRNERMSVEIRKDIRDNILNRSRQKYLMQDNSSFQQNQQKEYQMSTEKMDQEEEENLVPQYCQNLLEYSKQDIYQRKEDILSSLILLEQSYDKADNSAYVIGDIIDSEIVPFLMKMADIKFQDHDLRYYSIKLISNLTYGILIQVEELVKYDCLQIFYDNFRHSLQNQHFDILESVLQGVCNLIYTKNTYKDTFLKYGMYDELIMIVKNIPHEKKYYNVFKYTAQALFYFSSTRPPAGIVFDLSQLGYIMKIFNTLDDLDLLLDLSWFIVNMCALNISKNLQRVDNSQPIQYLLDAGVVQMIKKSTFSSDENLITAGLRIIEFLFQGKKEVNEYLVKIFLEQQIMYKIQQHLENEKRQVRLESLKVVYRMSQVQGVPINLFCQDFIPKVLKICKDNQTSVKSECMRILGNLFEFFEGANNYLFSSFSLLEILISNLSQAHQDNDLIWNSLQILEWMLEYLQLQSTQERYNIAKQTLLKSNVLPNVEQLQSHPQERIYKLSFKILERFDHEEVNNSIQEEIPN